MSQWLKIDMMSVACRHASPDDTRAERFRAGHVNLTFAGSGACGMRVWPAGSRVDVVRESARRLLMEGRMKDVKMSVRENVVLPMGAALILV